MIRLKLNRAAKAANCNVPLFVSRYTGEQARNGLLPCVGGYTCVQRRDGRGNTCVAKTHTHSLDPRLNRTTCCVDF